MVRESNVATRGQVFYYNPIWGIYGKDKEPKSMYSNNGSLEFKKRPYLVISTDKGNFSSTTCNIIPITSRDTVAIPSQVKFTYNGRNQVILTEQITTCNFKDLGEYCYTVSEEILNKVQKGMYIQFGLNLRTPEVTMEELAEKLEAIVDKVIENTKRKTQNVSVPQDIVDGLAVKLGSAVESLLDTPEKVVELPKAPEALEDITLYKNTPIKPKRKPVEQEPVKPSQPKTQNSKTPNYSGMSAIEKFNAKYGRQLSKVPDANPAKPIKETKNSDVSAIKKPRKQPWDIEKQKQFLEDCDRLSPDELMSKYEFYTKKDLYNHKYLIKTRLKSSDD